MSMGFDGCAWMRSVVIGVMVFGGDVGWMGNDGWKATCRRSRYGRKRGAKTISSYSAFHSLSVLLIIFCVFIRFHLIKNEKKQQLLCIIRSFSYI